MINFKSEAEGFYTLSLGTLDAAGNEVDCYEPVPTFPNLITNGGLERMGDNFDWLSRTYVGSGSAAPDFDDSAMNNFVAVTTTFQTFTEGAQSSAPYFTWVRITRRFAAGAAAGNLSEVGMGWSAALFSRALIVDAEGNPTTITVGADQFLDVTYEFRFYPKTTDDTGSFTLTGSVGGTYDYIFRAATVTSSSIVSGWSVSGSGISMGQTAAFSSERVFRDGVISGVTGSPSGASSGASQAVLAYESGSFQRKFTISVGLDGSNFAAGVRSAYLRMGIGMFQIQFDPAIPKTNERTLSLEFSHSWGRRA